MAFREVVQYFCNHLRSMFVCLPAKSSLPMHLTGALKYEIFLRNPKRVINCMLHVQQRAIKMALLASLSIASASLLYMYVQFTYTRTIILLILTFLAGKVKLFSRDFNFGSCCSKSWWWPFVWFLTATGQFWQSKCVCDALGKLFQSQSRQQ